MVLAATTYSFRDRPLEEALREIAGAGLSAVEVWLPHVGSRSDAARAALAANGLHAVAIAAGGAYRPGDTAVADGARLARALGAPVVVACVAPDLLPGLVRTMAPGVTLCVENHWDQPLSSGRAVAAALAGEPGAAACLDTGHALAAGEDPARFARLVASRLQHVHLKDARSPSLALRLAGVRIRRRLGLRPDAVMPGCGALDLAGFRRALDELRYEHAVSIEYEGPEAAAALAAAVRAWDETGSDGAAR